MGRHLVIVDVETSGLRDFDACVEVAWLDVDTGARGAFVPAHDPAWVARYGQPAALNLNRYTERLADAPQDDGTELVRLYLALRGNALAGSNPGFDAGHLTTLFLAYDLTPIEPWHHRMPDVSNYAAGVLGLDPRELPGLAKVCELLGVEPGDHTAERDVDATAACFARLAEIAAETPSRSGDHG